MSVGSITSAELQLEALSLQENNWKTHPNGENYSRWLVTRGRSDLLRTVTDILRPQIDALNQEWRDRKTRDTVAQKLVQRARETGVSGRPAERLPPRAGSATSRRGRNPGRSDHAIPAAPKSARGDRSTQARSLFYQEAFRNLREKVISRFQDIVNAAGIRRTPDDYGRHFAAQTDENGNQYLVTNLEEGADILHRLFDRGGDPVELSFFCFVRNLCWRCLGPHLRISLSKNSRKGRLYRYHNLKACEILSGDGTTLDNYPAVVSTHLSEWCSRSRKKAVGCAVLSPG